MSETVSATFRELRDGSEHAFDERLAPFFEPGEELIYDVHLPSNLDRADPPGVFVYVSPKPGARLPELWDGVLDRHNLVWVGARDSGNEVHVARRVAFALLARTVAARIAATDPSRTLLAGFSGGGRVASMMMPAYPDRFAGALFICGANPLFVASEDTIDALRQIPMVFLTGTGDFNLEDSRMAFATFHQAGVAKAKLIVVDGLGHALPSAEDLDVAIGSLSPG